MSEAVGVGTRSGHEEQDNPDEPQHEQEGDDPADRFDLSLVSTAGTFGPESFGVVAGGDQQHGRGVSTDAVQREEAGCGSVDESPRWASRRSASSLMAWTRRPRVRRASLAANMTGSLLGWGRSDAATPAIWDRGRSRSRSRRSSGAQNPRCRIWLRHAIRVSRPERFAIRSVRIASTFPSADLAIPVARPLDTLGRPRQHRACRTSRGPGGPGRLGRSTSITSRPWPGGDEPARRHRHQCLHPDPVDGPEAVQPTVQLDKPARVGRERLHAQHTTVRVRAAARHGHRDGCRPRP